MKAKINYNIDKNANNKEGMIINYFNEGRLCSKIFVNISSKLVTVINFTNNNIEKAFGVNENPSWTDFEDFLERRCFPRDRQNLKFELKKLGLNEYNPLEICKVTGGRNYKDNQWMEFSEKLKEEEMDKDDSYGRD